MIYFTSDLHFGHNRDFIYKVRGFNSVEEMNEALLHNYNEVVKEDDIVYILGDCTLGDVDTGIEYLKKLNGSKTLILGNHDSGYKIERYIKEGIFDVIEYGLRIRGSKYKTFFLSHYPTLVNNFKDPVNVWNLHGHTHSKEVFEIKEYKNYNVSVDAHNNYPVSLEQVLSDINEREQNVRY